MALTFQSYSRFIILRTLTEAKDSSGDIRRKAEGMKKLIVKVFRNLHDDESGQDLIEYALVAALIAFAAVTTMQSLAVNINTAFSKIASNLSSATS